MKTVDLFSLDGKSVVITGGLGQLGRQFTKALLAQGAKVAILDYGSPPPEYLAHQAGMLDEDSLRIIKADVTSRQSLTDALTGLREDWGTPHGLINNAALDAPPNAPIEENGPFETYPEESWDKVMDVNVKGTYLACQIFGAAMAEAGRGSIVNISSTYGVLSPDQSLYEYRRKAGAPFYKPVTYSVSKSAILNLTRYLATYWAQSGVRVNTATFGGVFNNQDEAFLEAYCDRVPLARMANEDEYNGAIIYLISGASSYMTGSNLVIDGGWTAW